MKQKYKERIELHCHTGYSGREGATSVKDIIDFSTENNMKSVAFTDVDNLMAYPEIQRLSEGIDGFKPIYGVEARIIDDLIPIVGNLKEDVKLDTDVVVISTETSGFNPSTNEIIELSAVKIEKGKTTNEYHSMVKPLKPISREMEYFTGIDNSQLLNAKSIEEILPGFIEFVGKNIVVGKDVRLDIAFIKTACEQNGFNFENGWVDTTPLFRLAFPEQGRLLLDDISKICGIEKRKRENAFDDTILLANIYLKLIAKLRGQGINSFSQASKSYVGNTNLLKHGLSYRTTILVKNREGLQALYKLVSKSMTEDEVDWPKMFLSDLLGKKSNLLLGAGWEGELSRICDGGYAEEEKRLAEIYDYFEIQPVETMGWICNIGEEDVLLTKNEIKRKNIRILEVGAKFNKLVVAVGNVHYLRSENGVSRSVLMGDNAFTNPPDIYNSTFKTTDEMLKEFDYLGEEKAYEVVIENTNEIGSQIEEIYPLYEDRNFKWAEGFNYRKSLYYKGEGDYQRLEELCYEGLIKKYRDRGYADILLKEAKDRLQEELKIIKENSTAYYFILLYDLIKNNGMNPSQYNTRGSAASLLVCYLLDISHVDPLDHDVCLYSEALWGIDGEKSPDIDVNVNQEIWSKVLDSLRNLNGIKKAYRASMPANTWPDTVEKWIESYEQKVGSLTDEQKKIVRHDCESIVEKQSLHPGKIIAIPEDADYKSVFPIMKSEEGEEISQFDYHSLDNIFEQLDILEHDGCTLCARLCEEVGYYPTDDDIREEEICSLLTSTENLGIKNGENYGINSGLLGIPSWTNEFSLKLVEKLQPRTFADLVKLEAIIHGTGTWFGNGEKLIEERSLSLSNLIGSREDVYEKLLDYGIDRKDAFLIAENVRKGKLCRGKAKPEIKKTMQEHGIPDWYIWSCEQIKYLFPRAHCAEYVQLELRLLYYKLHYPESYYKKYFEIYADEDIKEMFSKGEEGFDELNYYLITNPNAKLRDLYDFKVWNEMRLRL